MNFLLDKRGKEMEHCFAFFKKNYFDFLVIL